MVIKIKLKNADKFVLLDHEVFEALNSQPLFKEYKVFDNLRQHSSGVPVFQKYLDTVNGKLRVESIYLALHIAKKYLPQPESDKRLFLGFANGDKLDLRLKNLKWEPMSNLSRGRPTNASRTGFRGVRSTPQGKFVATISNGIKQVYLGTFDTPEEAALIYNAKSTELFGAAAALNPLDENGKPVASVVYEKSPKKEKKKKTVGIQLQEVEQITLAPVHFGRPKKRGRKPKSVSKQLNGNKTSPSNGHAASNEAFPVEDHLVSTEQSPRNSQSSDNN